VTDDLAHRSDIEVAPPTFELSDDLASALGSIPRLLELLVDENRNRQRPAVGIYRIDSTAPFVSHVGLRARTIVIASIAATIGSVQVGSEPVFDFNLPAAETRAWPWPRNIPRGVDVVLASAGEILTGYIIADNE
jgi:hypothetical protein